MRNVDRLKQFIFNGFLLDNDFSLLKGKGIIVRSTSDQQNIVRLEENSFSPIITYNGNKMSSVYVIFFCLENSVRDLISERLLERKGIEWWTLCVPKKIKDDVEKLKAKEEKNKYHTQRSSSMIGYTMFGNLSQIIINNWEEFSDIFPDQAWINSRFNDLEMSRNIIMHTGILPEIEIDRIESIVRDWFRQVG
jgi:hypothetical protein